MSADRRRQLAVDLVLLVVALLAVRTAVLRVLPTSATSDDVHSWLTVMNLLSQGQDPYTTTRLLNWPPFWLQTLYVLNWLSTTLHIDPTRAIQGTLVAVETAVVLVIYPLLLRGASRRTSLLVVLFGWILNPVAIILTCVHGNFDVFVGLWVLIGVAALARWYRSGEPADWIASAAFVGLGALTKTAPLVLGPVLALNWRRLPLRVLGVGALVFLGPIALGMSIIYVLGPQGVTEHVLSYRSLPGYFGVSGLLSLAGASQLDSAYASIFGAVLVVGAVLVGIRLDRQGRPPEVAIYAGCALLLVAIPGLGPGYGAQYIEWSLPLLLVVFARSGIALRCLLFAFLLIASLTYAAEYAVVPYLGDYLTKMGVHALDSWGPYLGSQTGATVARLPLFAAYIALIAGLVTAVVRRRPEGHTAAAGVAA